MLEKDIESEVCSYATKAYDMLCDKFTSPSRRAVPDRLFQGHGDHHFFIEFKATGKAKTVHAKATGHEGRQWRDHEKRRKRGHRVYVVDDIEIGKGIIDNEVAVNRVLSEHLAQFQFTPSVTAPPLPGANG